MAFTQTDLDSIDAALVQLALGRRVKSITIAGETTEFSDGATTADLMNIRSFVESKVTPSSGRSYLTNGGRG